MDRLPTEVVIKICFYLDFHDIAALRCTGKKLAEIAAEYLVQKIRFHCSYESLERLKGFARHEIFRKHIKTIVFEGNILADVPCRHAYAAHYDLEHHQNDKPQRPPVNCTSREQRLYERNLGKFDREIWEKYTNYRQTYNAQQEVIKSTDYGQTISNSVLEFSQLEKIVLTTVGRCKHVLSERFMQKFAVDCAMPIEHDTKHTKEQLQHLLLPEGISNPSVQELEAHVISPKFFTGYVPADKLVNAFKNLKTINLNFRLEKLDRRDLEMGMDFCYADLAKGGLRQSLEAASNLESLTINFDDFGYYGSCLDMKNIMGDFKWPALKSLNLDCIVFSQTYFIQTLKRQTSLKYFDIGFAMLDNGYWPQTLDTLRNDFNFAEFDAHGILEDGDRMYSMDMIDADMYIEDLTQFSVSDAISTYVCRNSMFSEENDLNPLIEDGRFADPDDLKEEFGPFESDDDEDDSEMDCD